MLITTLAFALASGLSRPPVVQSQYSFAVRVVGRGKPMILIPGLSCGGDVWDSTVAHYKDRYKCYILTLPGFAGQPPIAPPILPKVHDEIISYISQNHLDHPVVVGHSLGGTMALWIAATSPESVGKVVAVDGVPFLPVLMNPSANVKSIKPLAESVRAMLGKQTPTAFAASNKQSLGFMITSSKDVEMIQKTSSLSDPKSVGEAVYEMFLMDLRPDMAKVQSPVLLLAAGSGFKTPEQQKGALDSYEAQIRGIPNCHVKLAVKARHFIMLDDPDFYFREIDAFLK
jgi:pimeloyl-ACP methyl ester carboxylesterase